jgi:TolA-binding protein
MNRIKSLTLLAVMLTAASLLGDEATNQFNAAKAAFGNENYEAARIGFDGFLTRFSSHAKATEATFYLGESQMYLRQFPQAETTFNRLLPLGLNDQYARCALFRLAEIPYIQGDFAKAKPRLEDFVDKLSQDVNLQFVLYYLGDIAMRGGRVDAADEADYYFEQSVRMFPEGARYLDSLLGFAWAKNKLGKVSEADAIYAQLMNSTNVAIVEQATYQYGIALFERRAYQEAINLLTTFQSRYPASAYLGDSQRLIARCMGRLDNFDGALQILSKITQPTPDDMLLKVRMLYGLKKMQEAKVVLDQTKAVAGVVYRDEIALLESVFLTDQKDWRGAISLLESILNPQYDANNNRMIVNYLSSPMASGAKKLSEEAFFRACSLLTEAYASNRQQEKATALLNEMQAQAALSGNIRLTNICAETVNKLANVSPTSSHPSGWGGNTNAQWSPSTGQGSGNRPQLAPLTQGSHLNQFWRAEQLYRAKNYEGTVQQLEQILSGFYNQIATPPLYIIHYNITGATGTLNEQTFARACALLALSKAQLGDIEQANAVLMTLGTRISMNDPIQGNLLRETYDQLAMIASGGNGTTGGTTAPAPLLSATEQSRLFREANTAFRKQDYRLTDEKVSELIASNPGEAIIAEALFLQGKAQYGLGREQDSIRILERIADEFPNSKECPEALWFLGLYHEMGGDSIQAVEYFQVLVERFKNFKHIDGAMYYLAVDDLNNGNGRTGTTYLNQVHRNHRNGLYWSHAVWTLAYEAFKKKNYSQAEMYVQEILRNPPDVAIVDRVLYLKGELALLRGDYSSAFLAFKEVTKHSPTSPLAYYADDKARMAANKNKVNIN